MFYKSSMSRISLLMSFLAVFGVGCSSIQTQSVYREKSQLKYASHDSVAYSSNAKTSLVDMRGYFDDVELYSQSRESMLSSTESPVEFYILNTKDSMGSSCVVYSLAFDKKLFSSAGSGAKIKCTAFLEAKGLKKIELVKEKIDRDSYILKQAKPAKAGYLIGVKVEKAKTTLASTQETSDFLIAIGTAGLGAVLTQYIPRITDSDIKIELMDDTNNLKAQNKKHDELMGKPFKAYMSFLKTYDNGYYYTDTKREIVERFFDFDLKGTKLGEQEDFTGRGLITSNSGVCQNIEKHLEIRPKFNIAEAEGINLTVSLRGTLKRYYRPVALNSQEDPIDRDTNLSLNPANRYSSSQSFDYGCVPTSMKIASIGFSLLAKVAGMLGKNVGDGTIPTELKKTAFVIDVLEVN